MEYIVTKALHRSTPRVIDWTADTLGEESRSGAQHPRHARTSGEAFFEARQRVDRTSSGKDAAVQATAVATRFESVLWMQEGVCAGHTSLFFPPPGERPEAREVRESRARALCYSCPVLEPCRQWARENREYGFWGGESEEERAAAGYRVDMPVGRVARYPRGEGKPVAPRAARIA
jgi:WhiB family transcriptional regulator, redox-sensing transcriptional regulator